MPETKSETIEQDLQVVYHALLMIQRTLGPEARQTALQARLLGMRQALEAACKLATADTEEDWSKLRAQLLNAARRHYNSDGVEAHPQWRRKRGIA